MTGAADLAGRDLLTLRDQRRQAQHVAILQDRFRREAESIGVAPDCRETSRLIEMAKDEAAASADREGLIALALRFAVDEASGRPAPHSPANAPIPSRDGLVARMAAALRGASLKGPAS